MDVKKIFDCKTYSVFNIINKLIKRNSISKQTQ